MKSSILSLLLGCGCLAPATAKAQVNSGSDGHDGAFNPTQNVEIDMADHPDGIYQYTSVNIPAGVTVTFKPNAKNSPVVWLVQENCAIAGAVNLNGGRGINPDGTVSYSGAEGGPGGYAGGHGGSVATGGQGPGGGQVPGRVDGSYGTLASYYSNSNGTFTVGTAVYGNKFILPLLGGSGGGGGDGGGGGGGGAILIAVSGSISVTGAVSANGGTAYATVGWGSGGAIRRHRLTLISSTQ